MEKNESESTLQLGDFKSHWLGYVVASIFLYIEGNRLNNIPIMVIGILVGVAAVIILLGIIPHRGLRKISSYVDDTFAYSGANRPAFRSKPATLPEQTGHPWSKVKRGAG